MLKVPLAAEVLPVGILDPHGHHVLIAQIVLVLQIVQGHHQPSGDAWCAVRGMIGRSQSSFKRCPIDPLPQLNQRMFHVDQLLQINLKQLALRLILFSVRTHIFPQVMGRFEVISEIIIALIIDICCCL